MSCVQNVDLRFSPAEIRAFLHQTLPVPLSPEVVARLEAQIEGWPAGLRLATLAVQGRQAAEIEPFLVTLAGSHGHIIAAEFVVSVNTIETQVRSIYRKLDVHSRDEAGDVGRQLNLL